MSRWLLRWNPCGHHMLASRVTISAKLGEAPDDTAPPENARSVRSDKLCRVALNIPREIKWFLARNSALTHLGCRLESHERCNPLTMRE